MLQSLPDFAYKSIFLQLYSTVPLLMLLQYVTEWTLLQSKAHPWGRMTGGEGGGGVTLYKLISIRSQHLTTVFIMSCVPPRFSIFTPAKQKLVHQLSFLTCFPDNMNCKNMLTLSYSSEGCPVLHH